MISYSINIEIVEDPTKAPNYQGTDVELLKMVKAIIVKKGTEAGNPSIDIQLKDQHGRDFVIMATAALFEGIAAAIKGVESR